MISPSNNGRVTSGDVTIHTMSSPTHVEVTEDQTELRRLKKKLLEAQIKELEPKTWRDHLDAICSFAYVKEMAPAIVLAIVAIFALSASAAAQKQINDVNSSLSATQTQLTASQSSLLKANDDLKTLSESFVTLQRQFNDTQSAAQQQLLAAQAQFQANLALKTDSEFQLSAAFNGSLAVHQQIATLNQSYPYPWTLQQQLQQQAAMISSLQTRLSAAEGVLSALQTSNTTVFTSLATKATALSLASTAWRALPPLQNSWTAYMGPPAYRLDALGVVRFQGGLGSGVTDGDTVMFTLPTGFCPAVAWVYAIVASGGSASSYCSIYAKSDCTVRVQYCGGNGDVDLTGLSFSVL